MSIINREDIIAKIISLTSPWDACRSMLVSSLFKSAADSDEVWEKFLPPDYRDIICKSLLLTPSSLTFLSKKVLYFYFSHHPIVFDIDNLSFLIDKQTGKKCYMIGARGLSIHLSDNPENWEWIYIPNSRFSEMVRLKGVTKFIMEGRLDAKHLSPKTTYGAYLIFKTEGTRKCLEGNTVVFYVIVERRRYEIIFGNEFNRSQHRRDGTEEIKIGELYNDVGDEGDWVCRIVEDDPRKFKSGIIVEGIEFRPKSYLLHHLDTDNMLDEMCKEQR